MNNLRKTLTLAHKIVAKLKMDDLTYTHLSVRTKKEDEFLLSPFGIQFADIKPKDILHFNLEGKLFSKPQNFNQTGFWLHSTIYKAKNNINAVIHLHTKETIAVSVQKHGLLPVSQHALHFYEKVSSHSYNSLILKPEEERKILLQDLGENNVMLLQNHGFLTTGKTVWEALFYAYHLQKACEVQVLLPNINEVIIPPHNVCLKARSDLLSFEKDLGIRDFKSFKF